MNQTNRVLSVFLMMCLPLAVFSQKAASKTEESRSSGMRKVASGQDLDIDIKIDHKQLEADIEAAVEDALRSIEHSLEGLEIHIEPISINLDKMDLNLEPLVINIPELNIEIAYRD